MQRRGQPEQQLHCAHDLGVYGHLKRRENEGRPSDAKSNISSDLSSAVQYACRLTQPASATATVGAFPLALMPLLVAGCSLLCRASVMPVIGFFRKISTFICHLEGSKDQSRHRIGNRSLRQQHRNSSNLAHCCCLLQPTPALLLWPLQQGFSGYVCKLFF